MFFDSHAHYDDPRFEPDRELLLSRLPQEGVGLVMNVGADLSSSAPPRLSWQKDTPMYTRRQGCIPTLWRNMGQML